MSLFDSLKEFLKRLSSEGAEGKPLDKLIPQKIEDVTKTDLSDFFCKNFLRRYQKVVNFILIEAWGKKIKQRRSILL